MTDLNRVVLIGNLTKGVTDDQYSFGYTNNGTAHAVLSLACNRSRKQGDQWVDDVSYFQVQVWGKTAENLKQYFVKGQKLGIEGYLKQERWEKDGKKESRVSIIADNVWLLGGGKPNGTASNASANHSQPNQMYSAPVDNNAEGFSAEGFSEDIPF